MKGVLTALLIGGTLTGAVPSAPAGAQIHVSPAGSDSGDGSITSPYRTIQKGLSAAQPGMTVYLRGGTYVNSLTITFPRSGLVDQPIRLWAYPGETPVLDFSPQPPSSSMRGVSLGKNFWHLKGLHVGHAGDNGIYISGSYNTVEQCVLFENEDTGLQISGGGSYNLVLNCDSRGNYDSASHGENADGFAPKLEIGPGNVFRGCRAYDNADDGWDMFESNQQVVMDSCWAFRNGFNIWGDPSFQGDGNGFKLGGNFVAAPHLVLHCLAFDNRDKGFDQNNNTAGQTLYNCTGWRNGRNFVLAAAPATGQHVLKNNLSYGAAVQIHAGSLQQTNSWQGFTVTAADFEALDTSAARIPRDPDGSIPRIGLLRLAPGSSLIDAGVEVGFPFRGPAPDIGAYEYDGPDGVAGRGNAPAGFGLLGNYPNPFNPATAIVYELSRRSRVELAVVDILGRTVAVISAGEQASGVHRVVWSAAGMAAGVYTARLAAVPPEGGRAAVQVLRMVLVK
ncbi:MAG: right-handed parallel beta-helix repeat-containing protein [Bacteroidota bacterium]